MEQLDFNTNSVGDSISDNDYKNVVFTLRGLSDTFPSSMQDDYAEFRQGAINGIMRPDKLLISKEQFLNLVNVNDSNFVGLFFHFGLSRTNYKIVNSNLSPFKRLYYDNEFHLTINRAYWNTETKTVIENQVYNLVQRTKTKPPVKNPFGLPVLELLNNNTTPQSTTLNRFSSDSIFQSSFVTSDNRNEKYKTYFISTFGTQTKRGFFIGNEANKDTIDRIIKDLNETTNNYVGLVVRFFYDNIELQISLSYIKQTNILIAEEILPLFTSYLSSDGSTTPPNGIPQVPAQ